MASAPAGVLYAYLLLVSLTFPIDSRAKRLDESECEAITLNSTDSHTLGNPVSASPASPLPFPQRELGSAFRNPTYLGKGSFGMSFLVTKKATGQQMVMKLLYREVAPKSYQYYTWGMVKNKKTRVEEMTEAAEECDISAKIHEQGMKLSERHPGAQRVMNCFGHNIPVVDGKVVERTGSSLEKRRADSEPLYLLLENCGAKNLGSFMQDMASRRQLTLVLVKQLFKQIMEGLDFLASLTVKYIHHDLKPANIVVKTQTDGNGTITYSVHLIDFGGTTQADRAHLCTWTPCTRLMAPKEYDIPNNNLCDKKDDDDMNFDPRKPLAFDVWSAGCILTNLITGVWLYELSPKTFVKGKLLNHAAISSNTHGLPKMFAKYVENARKDRNLARDMKGYETVTQDALADAQTFSQLLAGMLALEAKDRFVARDVLRHGWLDGIEVVDDLDYQAALPRPSVAVSEEEEESGPVLLILLYSENDEVEVFSRTLFKHNGLGWTVGRVTQAYPDGRVEVEYPVKDDILFKTLNQQDADIRPVSDAPQVDDDESVSSERSVMVNFVPAKRRNEKPLDQIVEEPPDVKVQAKHRNEKLLAKFVEEPPDVKGGAQGHAQRRKQNPLDQIVEEPPVKEHAKRKRKRKEKPLDQIVEEPPDVKGGAQGHAQRRKEKALDQIVEEPPVVKGGAQGHAQRRKEKPLDQIVVEPPVVKERVSVLSTAKCPEFCQKCAPAFEDVNSIPQRRIYRKKYASFCYVLVDDVYAEERKRERNDKQVRCSTKSEGAGKALAKDKDCIRFLCQDKALFDKKPPGV